MSPALACVLMAAATAPAWVRWVVTFWAEEIEPGDDGHSDHGRPHLGIEQRRGAQRDHEDERQEDHRGVARRERAPREDAAGDGGEEGPHHNEGDAPRARAGVQIEFDDAIGLADAEEGEGQHGEVDDGEEATLVGAAGQGRALVVAEAGDGVDDRREVRRRGPGGRRVLRLVDEGGHPGQEEDEAADEGQEGRHRRAAPAAAATGAHNGDEEPQPRHADEVERPVLGVEQRGGHDGHRDEVARPRRLDGPLQRQEAEAGQEDDQRVHPGLGAVVNGKGRAGQQHQRGPGHGPAAEALPAQPGDGQREDGNDPREGADGVVRLSEEGDPEVEEVVVERRRPVVLERLGDGVEGQTGDVDRERLVEPEAGTGPETEHQTDGHHEHHAHARKQARTTGESGNLLWHGAHGRTRGSRSRIIRRQAGPRAEGNQAGPRGGKK